MHPVARLNRGSQPDLEFGQQVIKAQLRQQRLVLMWFHAPSSGFALTWTTRAYAGGNFWPAPTTRPAGGESSRPFRPATHSVAGRHLPRGPTTCLVPPKASGL